MIALVTAQQIAFWVFAPLAILGALAMVFCRRPVHSALGLAGMMICLAGLYASLDGPFLFVTQIIVYTGAIMMLFVFTMMIVGIDTIDSMIETLKGQRALTAVAVLGFAALLILAVGNGVVTNNGLADANNPSNVAGLADLIFGRYVFAFEATAALLITAALAAMVLSHGEKLRKKPTQQQRAAARITDYATEGKSPAPLPGPGVYARHNATDYPALLPDGSVAEGSISPTLNVRGVAIVTNDGLRNPHLAANQSISKAWDELSGESTAERYRLDAPTDKGPEESQRALSAGENAAVEQEEIETTAAGELAAETGKDER